MPRSSASWRPTEIVWCFAALLPLTHRTISEQRELRELTACSCTELNLIVMMIQMVLPRQCLSLVPLVRLLRKSCLLLSGEPNMEVGDKVCWKGELKVLESVNKLCGTSRQWRSELTHQTKIEKNRLLVYAVTTPRNENIFTNQNKQCVARELSNIGTNIGPPHRCGRRAGRLDCMTGNFFWF